MYGMPLPERELPGSIDWNAVGRLAKKHVVTGIIIDSIGFLPERLRPCAAVRERMDRFALGLIRTNMVLDRTAAFLADFFRRHGIHGVLLKGQGVARYYRTPQMRQSGDIDYYAGRKLYRKALRLCRENLVDDTGTASEVEKHFGFTMHGVHIELHRYAARMFSPVRNRRFQKWVTWELEHSPHRRTLTIGNTDITLPSLDFDAVYIFYHAWCHYITGGIGLRQLCDWAMIFHKHGRDIDIERLKENISRFGMTKGWKLFACIAVRHLGVPEHEMPLYDRRYEEKSEKILDEIVTGGNFGFYSKTYARTVRHKNFLPAGLAKAGAVTRYFISLFPIIPAEATFLYFNRLFFGTIAFSKRSISKADGHPRKT